MHDGSSQFTKARLLRANGYTYAQIARAMHWSVAKAWRETNDGRVMPRTAVLTPALVRRMRQDRVHGMTIKALSEKYGVAQGAAWAVVRRRTWKWVL